MRDIPTIRRRAFLERMGAGTLGAVAAAGVAERARAASEKKKEWEPTSDRKIRIGVVGGGFGASFQWHLDPNCTVEAVSDLRTDRRARLQQVYSCERPYESLEKLVLDPKIEAVAVFTGAPDHARHVVLSMKHGKHVISAVPACLTLEEAELLKETKEKTGLKYMMAETTYYRAPTMFARQVWADGAFGEFLYTEVEYYHHAGKEIGKNPLWWYQGERTWRYGFPPMLYVTHSSGFHVGVTRERFTHVSALGWGPDHEAYRDNAYDNPFNNMVGLFKTDRGNICRCNVCWHLHAGGERAQWIGQFAALYMGSSGGQPLVFQQAGEPDVRALPDYLPLLPEPMRVETGHGGSHTFLTHEFLAALVEEREPAIDLYEALAMTIPGIVANESARKGGQQMKVPSFDRV